MGFRIVGLMNCWMEIVIKELWAGELCCKLIMGLDCVWQMLMRLEIEW